MHKLYKRIQITTTKLSQVMSSVATPAPTTRAGTDAISAAEEDACRDPWNEEDNPWADLDFASSEKSATQPQHQGTTQASSSTGVPGVADPAWGSQAWSWWERSDRESWK